MPVVRSEGALEAGRERKARCSRLLSVTRTPLKDV